MTVGVFTAALLGVLDGGLSISEILALPREEAARGRPVVVEGVITYADPVGRDFFVEADGAAISMWYPDAGLTLKQGDRVRLRGRTSPGDYAPKLEPDPQAVERLATGVAIPATAPTQAELASGSIDCRSVTIDAIVRAVRESDGRIELRLADLFGPTRLLFPVGVAVPDARAWIGAEVRLRATVAVDLNERRQRTGLRLYAQHPGEIVVRQPARSTRELPRSRLGELLQYHPVPTGDPRVRVRGTVSYVSGQSAIVTDGPDTARVRFVREAPIADALVGSVVEVVGFVEVLKERPLLGDAVLLSSEPGTLAARPVPPSRLLDPALDDHLVSVEGTVVQHVSSPVALLSLEGDGVPFLAMTLASSTALPVVFAPGSRVTLTGIKATTTDQVAPVVLLRGPGDARLIAAPPFWNLGRALAAAGLLLGLLLAALIRIRALRVASAALEQKVSERTERLAERTRELELQREELLTLHGLRARSIAVIAHDVRSPLSAIQLNADLLGTTDDARSRRDVVDDISRAVQQVSQDMTELVRRYRDEEVLLRRERMDLGDAAKRALERARTFLHPKRQRVSLEGTPSRVLGDEGVVEHVLVNLLSNASKYSQPDTVITVRFGEPGVISIIDRGVGLEADDLACLFDPKRRPKNRPTGNEPTSGEGLLLAHRWIAAMGGSISCVSVRGEGSEFTVRLPPA